MTVMAENLTRKYNENKYSSGAMTALQNVGDLFNNRMTREEFDSVTNRLLFAGTNDKIPAARRAFNEGYLNMLDALVEL
jgi:hypothetical protein